MNGTALLGELSAALLHDGVRVAANLCLGFAQSQWVNEPAPWVGRQMTRP